MMTPISPEGPGHPNEHCASCHGTATKLTVVQTYGLPPRSLFGCIDRELCKTIMIMDNMIANVRSS